MPPRFAFRLPRKFNRPVSRMTRRVVERRHRSSFRSRFAGRWRRLARGTRRSVEGWRRTLLQWSLVGLVSLVLLVMAIVVFSPVGRIEEIRVTRTNPRLDIEGVQRTLSPLFGRYLVAVSSREVRQLLEQNIPDLQSVTVGKHYPSQLLVRVELDPLLARVAILDPESGDAAAAGSGTLQGCLTSRGIFTALPSGLQDQSLPVLHVVDWGVRPEPGAPLLSVDFLKRLRDTEEILRTQFNQDVARRVIFLRAQEYHLSMGKLSLWFDVRSTVEEQLQRYRIFLRTLGLSAAKEYVDLRLTDTVIYR